MWQLGRHNSCKVFCRIFLKSFDSAIDCTPREEQAGLCNGRGCIDQIVTLQNIIEQCVEFNACFHVNFINFKKAVIYIPIPIHSNIVKIVGEFYKHFECSVILDNTVTVIFYLTWSKPRLHPFPYSDPNTIDWMVGQTTSKHRVDTQNCTTQNNAWRNILTVL